MLYATDARKAIVSALKSERRYLSANAIYATVRRHFPTIALSTVYRTLERLSETGSVSRRSVEKGVAEYLYCGEVHHHHAVCRTCGRVDDVACQAMDGVRKELLESRAFVLDDHEITFYGNCAECYAVIKAP